MANFLSIEDRHGEWIRYKVQSAVYVRHRQLENQAKAERENAQESYRAGWAEGQKQMLACMDDDTRAAVQGYMDLATLETIQKDEQGKPVAVVCMRCGHHYVTGESNRCPKCTAKEA